MTEDDSKPTEALIETSETVEFGRIASATEGEMANLKICLELGKKQDDDFGKWRASDAQIIFAGLTPLRISFPATNRREFLPGGNPLKRIPENYDPANDFDYEAKLDSMLCRIESVIFGDQSRTPFEWLCIAIEGALPIYWLEAVLADHECCELVFGTTDRAIIHEKLSSISKADNIDFQSSGGKAKHRNSKAFQAQCILLRTYEDLPKDKKIPDAQFAEEMKLVLSTDGEVLCADSSIERWMTEIRKNAKNPGSIGWINDVHALNYCGHQSALSLLVVA